MPHISYDLDGDGHVGNRDYFLAKHFDKDKDNKLNETELAEARQAIKNGFENKFMFGLDRQGTGLQNFRQSADKPEKAKKIRII